MYYWSVATSCCNKKIPKNKRPEGYNVLFNNIINDTKCFQFNGFNNNIYNDVIPASFPFYGDYQTNSLIKNGC